MLTRTFLLCALALVTILAVGCGEVVIEKEVQIGKPVTVGGFTNDQLRSPEFKECLTELVNLLPHTHGIHSEEINDDVGGDHWHTFTSVESETTSNYGDATA